MLKFTKKMAEAFRGLAYMLSFRVFYKSMWFTKKNDGLHQTAVKALTWSESSSQFERFVYK